MKLDFLKKKNNFKKKDFTFNPNLYWQFTILGVLIVMIATLFFGYHLFKQVNLGSVLSTVNNSEQVPSISTDRIKKVLNYFSEREQKSKEILSSPVPVVDPSL
jgi:hypothetical protein